MLQHLIANTTKYYKTKHEINNEINYTTLRKKRHGDYISLLNVIASDIHNFAICHNIKLDQLSDKQCFIINFCCILTPRLTLL